MLFQRARLLGLIYPTRAVSRGHPNPAAVPLFSYIREKVVDNVVVSASRNALSVCGTLGLISPTHASVWAARILHQCLPVPRAYVRKSRWSRTLLWVTAGKLLQCVRLWGWYCIPESRVSLGRPNPEPVPPCSRKWGSHWSRSRCWWPSRLVSCKEREDIRPHLHVIFIAVFEATRVQTSPALPALRVPYGESMRGLERKTWKPSYTVHCQVTLTSWCSRRASRRKVMFNSPPPPKKKK